MDIDRMRSMEMFDLGGRRTCIYCGERASLEPRRRAARLNSRVAQPPTHTFTHSLRRVCRPTLTPPKPYPTTLTSTH